MPIASPCVAEEALERRRADLRNPSEPLRALMAPPRLGRWLSAVLVDWIILALTMAGALAMRSIPGYVAALFIVGNRQHALGILGHDGAHRLACRNRRLNDVLTSALCLWPLITGLEAYRKFHFEHHRKVGEPTDPEIPLRDRASGRYDLPIGPRRFVTQFVKDVFGAGSDEVIALVLYLKGVTVWDRLGPVLLWAIVGGGLVWAGAWQAVALWFVALFTTFWAYFRLRVFTEHLGIEGTHRLSLTWWQAMIIAPHNTWHHYEHHRWPAIPCDRLPLAREIEQQPAPIPLSDLVRFYRNIPS